MSGTPILIPLEVINTTAWNVATPPSGYVSLFSEWDLLKQKDSSWVVKEVANDEATLVHTTWDESIAGTKTFSWFIEFAMTLWKKISLYWTNYFFGIQSWLLQIWSWAITERVGIWYWTTWAFTETLSVKGGNVWVWQINPTTKLQVETSTANAARIAIVETWDTTDAHYTWLQLFESTTFRWGIFKSWLAQDISIWTATKAVTILASNNNVGINNTAPSEKLDVTWNIKTSGTIETLNTGGVKLWASAIMKFNTVSSSIDFIIN